jgi:hypothetical protein
MFGFDWIRRKFFGLSDDDIASISHSYVRMLREIRLAFHLSNEAYGLPPSIDGCKICINW